MKKPSYVGQLILLRSPYIRQKLVGTYALVIRNRFEGGYTRTYTRAISQIDNEELLLADNEWEET